MHTNRLVAHDGETLDGLLWRAARRGPETLPVVFAANPRMCERVTLNAGEVVILPDALLSSEEAPFAPAATPARVNLWD
jgi:phage tail protein X